MPHFFGILNQAEWNFSIRMIFTVLGYILGAAATTAVAGLFINMGWSKNAAYSGMGAVFGTVAVIALLVTTLGVKERARPELQPAKMPAWSQIRWNVRRLQGFMGPPPRSLPAAALVQADAKPRRQPRRNRASTASGSSSADCVSSAAM